MSDRLLDADDVAKRLKVGIRTVYKIVRRGEIPVVRVGRLERFRPEDIDVWILDRIGRAGDGGA